MVVSVCLGLLGTRLEAAEDLALQAQACLCYICAGSMEQLVSCWSKAQDSSSPLSLQVRLLYYNKSYAHLHHYVHSILFQQALTGLENLLNLLCGKITV